MYVYITRIILTYVRAPSVTYAASRAIRPPHVMRTVCVYVRKSAWLNVNAFLPRMCAYIFTRVEAGCGHCGAYSNATATGVVYIIHSCPRVPCLPLTTKNRLCGFVNG